MPSTFDDNDKDLLQRVAAGDESAFAELFHRYTAKIYPFILKLTKNDTDAREVLQETFLRIWVNRGKLIDVENPSAWIYRIASNVCITHLRNAGRRRNFSVQLETASGLGSSASTQNLELETEAKQLEGFISRAVTELPERRQLIYRMSREQGLTHQQIAKQLGLSQNTVKDQIGKALKSIHEYIQRSTGLSLLTILLLISL